MKELDVAIQRQEVALQDLKDQLEADTPQEQGLERLEMELKDAQDTQQMNEHQYGDAVLEKDRLNAQQRPIKNQLNNIQQELAEIDERIKEAQKTVHRAEDKRAAKLLETNRSYEAIGDADKAKDRLERVRAEQVDTVNSFTEQAELVSLRVPIDPGETVDSLEAKLNRLQREQARQREQ